MKSDTLAILKPLLRAVMQNYCRQTALSVKLTQLIEKKVAITTNHSRKVAVSMRMRWRLAELAFLWIFLVPASSAVWIDHRRLIPFPAVQTKNEMPLNTGSVS